MKLNEANEKSFIRYLFASERDIKDDQGKLKKEMQLMYFNELSIIIK